MHNEAVEGTQSLGTPLARVRAAIRSASSGLVERELLPELVVLAFVAREHVLIIGPPGTAKSEAVRRVSRTVDARYFEYLLGRFTEPNELFGPVDLSKLREGRVETDTTAMLPEAEIAFLDEVFLASSAILNTLLGILNERRFVRGHTRKVCPLRVCVGASNQLPEDPTLSAFADRFLLHAFVDAVADSNLENLLEMGRTRSCIDVSASLQDMDQLAQQADAVDLAPIRSLLARAVRTLRSEGIGLSDRRVVRIQGLIAAACVLRGSSVAGTEDLWPLVYAIPSSDAQDNGQEALRELLGQAQNETLVHATELASGGTPARAERLLVKGRALETAASQTEGQDPKAPGQQLDHRLKTEAWLREVDATLSVEQMPDELHQLRERQIKALEQRAHDPR